MRRDVERLRDLGYPVHATLGAGRRLPARRGQRRMPPLLLDDEEAVAVAVGLRTAASGTVAGIEEASVRALAKLEQVLPARLRHRVNALHSVTVPLPGARPAGRPGGADGHRRRRPRPPAAPLRLHQPRRHRGRPRRRTAPPGPHRPPLVPARLGPGPGRLAHLPRRPDHLTADHRAAIHPARPARRRRLPPTCRGRSPPRRTATRPASGCTSQPSAVAERLPPTVGHLQADGEHACILHTGAESPDVLAIYVAILGAEFEILDPPELAEHLLALASRLTRAARH